jgi:hypothetical protein
MGLIIGGNTISSSNINSSGEILSFYNFPTDGLVMDLNANNYQGGSSTWCDSVYGMCLNSRNSGEPYVTTPTPKVWVNSVPAIGFNGQSWWEGANSTQNNRVDLRGSFTLILIYWFPSNNSRRTIFEKAGTSYQSYQQELACTWEVSNDMSWYRAGGQEGTYDFANTKVYTLNQWNFIAIKGNADHTNGFYYNAPTSNWVSDYGNRSNVNILRSSTIRLGTGYAGIMSVGYLHSCMVWNVDLNTTRINEIYNYYSNLFNRMGVTLFA